MYHDYRSGTFRDWFENGHDGVPTDTQWTNGGLRFPESTSKVTVADAPGLQLTKGALVAFSPYGFTSQVSFENLISKRDAGGVNYQLYLASGQLFFYEGANYRTVNTDVVGRKQIGLNFETGTTSELFLDTDKPLAFSGGSVVTEDDAPLTLGGYYSPVNNFKSNAGSILIFNRPLTATEHAIVYGKLAAMKWPRKRYGTNDISSHSDWGANVTPVAISEGPIGSTPYKVLTGSFKVVDDVLNGKQIKAFECITNGTILFPPFGDKSDSDWTGWEDTGAGYVQGTLTLSSLVYSMTAGDKIAYADRAGNQSIIKEI
jgi:hypothetical protein